MNLDLSGLPVPAVIAIAVVVVLQIALLVTALVVLVRTPRERLVFGQKWPWVLVVLFLNVIGPIVFLGAGRRPAPVDDPEGVEPQGDTVVRVVDHLYGGGPG